jgi:transcriptional regulator with XRE-family HTH domain
MVENIRAFIALNIEARRKKAGLTQVEAAKLAGVSVRSLQRAEDMFEQGNLEISTLLALATALKVHPSKLFLEPNAALPVAPEEALEVIREALKNTQPAKAPEPAPAPLSPTLERVAALLENDQIRSVLMRHIGELEKNLPKRKAKASE